MDQLHTGQLMGDTVDDRLTGSELETRWNNVLVMTLSAVTKHPDVYRKLKSLAPDIVANPLDIREYLPTVQTLVGFLKELDPNDLGSIFSLFNNRITPSSIWDTTWLRMECKDLLAHLKVFDEWRLKNCGLKVVK